jgi:hypothetical protein
MEDEARGNLFLKRFLMGPQQQYIQTLDTIAALWDNHSYLLCPDDLLIYLAPIVGFDSTLDYITNRLSPKDLRKLIRLAIPFWKERFSSIGLVNAVALISGRCTAYLDWFHWRSILGETYLNEAQDGHDFWVQGDLVSRYDEYYSVVKVMDQAVDAYLLIDLLSLERVASERLEIILYDFLDIFSRGLDKWENVPSTPEGVGTITEDRTLLIESGHSIQAVFVDSDIIKDYLTSIKFKMAEGSAFQFDWYWDPTPPHAYRLVVKPTAIELYAIVSGTPTLLDSTVPPFPIYYDVWYKARAVTLEEDLSGDKNIKIYIDGNLIFDVNDSTTLPSSGNIAITADYIGPSGPGGLEIDNVELSRVPFRYAVIGPDGVDASDNFY